MPWDHAGRSGRGMERLSNHEMWRRHYSANRYLRHLTDDAVRQRFTDTFLNLSLLTPKGQYGLGSPADPSVQRWMIRFSQVLQELEMRFGPPPNGFSGATPMEPLPDFVGELGQKAANVLTDRGLRPGEFLIKYGRPDHMTALVRNGQIRIQPASFFKGAQLNGAVRDDEMSLLMSIVVGASEEVPLQISGEGGARRFESEQIVELNFEAQSDYWIYCLTQSAEPRLFVDFDASACVIIKNPKEFRERVIFSALSRMGSHRHSYGNVYYVDPHLPQKVESVEFAKHFRYTYQRESRFVWIPRDPPERFDYIDIEIGSLEDIAELIVL